jgi:hypothetical protein
MSNRKERVNTRSQTVLTVEILEDQLEQLKKAIPGLNLEKRRRRFVFKKSNKKYASAAESERRHTFSDMDNVKSDGYPVNDQREKSSMTRQSAGGLYPNDSHNVSSSSSEHESKVN